MITRVKYFGDDELVSNSIDRPGRVLATFQNGDTFEGYYSDTKSGFSREGLGVYKFHSGAEYAGGYHKSVKHGYGVFRYKSGDLYEGHWKYGLKHGKGIYTYPNGDIFYGKWKKDKRHGRGKFVYPSTQLALVGEWSNGDLLENSWTLVNNRARKSSTIPDTQSYRKAGSRRSGMGIAFLSSSSSVSFRQYQDLATDFNLVLITYDEIHDSVVAKHPTLRGRDQGSPEFKPLVEELVSQTIVARLTMDDVRKQGFFLHGYPRTETQARILARMGVEIDIVFHFENQDEDIDSEVDSLITHEPPVDPSLLTFYSSSLIALQAHDSIDAIYINMEGAISLLKQPLGIVISGPRNSGKTTLCRYIAEKYGGVYLSMDGLLKDEVDNGTEIGEEIKECAENGEDIPEELKIAMIENRFKQTDIKHQGFILDGFPETDFQLESLLNMGIKVDVVFYLEVSLKELNIRSAKAKMIGRKGSIHLLDGPVKITTASHDDRGVAPVCEPNEFEMQVLNAFGEESHRLRAECAAIDLFRNADTIIYNVILGKV